MDITLLLSRGIDLRQAMPSGRSAATKKCMGMMSTSFVRRDGSKGVKLADAAETRQTSILAKEQCHALASKFSKKRLVDCIMWLTTSRNIAHMEMYKVITEVRLKDVLGHSELTDFKSSSADLKSWWWIRRVRGKKSIRLLSAWKTSSSSSSLGRTLQKSRRKCVANLDPSSVSHTAAELRWKLFLENDFADGL